MPYTALPDRRMPYDNDGTVVAVSNLFTSGILAYPTQTNVQEVQGSDLTASTENYWNRNDGDASSTWLFFPEQREITAGILWFTVSGTLSVNSFTLQGSNDTTNGIDGTWETASLPAGSIVRQYAQVDDWRTQIKAVSFTGGKRTIRWQLVSNDVSGGQPWYLVAMHLYGEKVAGQTPDDVIYIDHDTTPGVEYAAPEDFGDQPLGTTVVRQFRLKNASATKTANSINVQCNDADFAISTDGTTWVVTINIASLGPGAQSATMYVRCTTPAPGNLLGPRFARIVTTVASYT